MTNEKAFSKAKDYISGGVNSPVRAFKSVKGSPVFIERAKDEFLYDIQGQKYIDFVLSWGPMILGHADKDVVNAVIKTARKGLSFGAPCTLETQLAKLILSKFSWLDKIRFCASGTEATMSAIRLARAYSKKDDIIKFEGCYHGHSDSLLVKAGSGATTFGTSSSDGVPNDFIKHTHLATYNDIHSVERCFAKSNQIGAVIIEPIAGNMGLVPAHLTFLVRLRDLCRANGAVLIFDEVMSGFRASLTGSYKFNKVKADIVTFGKVIGGGMNVAAFAGSDEIMSLISPQGGVYQAGTLNGNPVAMAAGIATLSKLYATPHIYEKLNDKAKAILKAMQNSAKKKGIAIQTVHRGSMFGFFFNENKIQNYADALKSDTKMYAKFHNQMLKRGVYLAPSQFETSFICTKMGKNSLEKVIEAIENSFKAL